MATELAKAYVQIIPSAVGIQGSISKLLDGEATSAGTSAGSKISSGLGGAIKKAMVGLGIGKIITDGITGTAEFETAMAKVSTLFSGTGDQFSALSSKILEMSSAFGVSATSLAEAAYSAESAGVPVESLGAMIESSAKLAVAGFTDIDTALSATAKTMNAYGMEGSDAISKVQNVLMQTQNLGITTVGELGAALANVTPTAAAAGVSFEQVGAALAQMTAAGVPTAQATTQLRSAIAELSKSGTKASDAFKAAAEGSKYAGMSFQEATASGMTMGDAFSMMQAYADASGLSMLDLWSSVEAGNAAMLIAGDVETFTGNLEAMADGADNVQAAYDKMADTFGTSMNRLKESAKNFMTTLFTGGDISASFDAMLDSLGDIGGKLTTWLTSALSGLGESLPQMMGSLLDFGAGLLESLGQVDWIQLGTTIINGIIGALGTLGTKLMDLMKGAISSITSGEVDFGEIGTKIFDGATSILGTLGETLGGLFKSAIDFLTGDGGILNSFGTIGQSILDAVGGILNPGGENFISKIFTDAESTINGIEWETLGNNVAKAGAALVNLTGEALAGAFTAAYDIISTIKWDALGTTIGNIANGLVSLTGETLAAAFTAAHKIIDTIEWEALGQTVGKAANGLISLTDEALSGAFTAAHATISTIPWEQLGTTVGKVADGLLNLTGDALSGAFTAAEAAINKIPWEGIGNTVAKAASGLLSLTDTALSAAFTGAETIITTIPWASIGETVGSVANELLKYTGATLAAPFQAAYDIMSGIQWGKIGAAIQEGLGSVWEGLTGFLGGVLGGAGEAASGLGSWVKDQLTGGNLKEVQDLQLALDALKKSLEKSQESLKTAAQNIGACIRGGIADELDAAKMNEIGANALTYIKAGATETEGDLDDKFAEIGKTAAEKFKVEDTWKPAGDQAIKSIQAGVESQESALTDKVGSIMDKIIADTKGKDWTGTGNSITVDIGSGIMALPNISDAAKQQAEAAKSAFTGQSWGSVGSNIVSGIAAGVRASAGVLISTMQGLASQALAAAKRALEISSPSKVMMNQVGHWIPEGIAEGIRRSEGSVTAAMRDMSDSMRNVDITDRLAMQSNSIAAGDQAALEALQSLADPNNGIVERIVGAILEGFDKANLSLYMDSQKVGSSVSRFLGKEIAARRYSY